MQSRKKGWPDKEKKEAIQANPQNKRDALKSVVVVIQATEITPLTKRPATNRRLAARENFPSVRVRPTEREPDRESEREREGEE